MPFQVELDFINEGKAGPIEPDETRLSADL